MSVLLDTIRQGRSKIFRRAYIKRRQESDGLFEPDWQEVTEDVKRWGKIVRESDVVRFNKFTFSDSKLVMNNDSGRYNDEESVNSLWNGYANQQRTLIKIEAGFTFSTLGADGIWQHFELPDPSRFDCSLFDEATFDGDPHIVFVGLIEGEINQNSKNEVVLTAKPLTDIFRKFQANSLNGYNNSLTASDFFGLVWDHTDGAGTFVFRQFFNETTTYWNIATTTNLYPALNTSTAEDLDDKTVWDVMVKLAEAENSIVYITKNGTLNFQPRSAGTTSAFDLNGPGIFDLDYGRTIKSIQKYGRNLSKYYSEVSVQFDSGDTSTSKKIEKLTTVVSANNNAWNYGEKQLSINNVWIANSTTAATIAANVFAEVSEVKREMQLSTSFIPHLDLRQLVNVNYDTSQPEDSLTWDTANWADSAGADDSSDLIWDDEPKTWLALENAEFRLIREEIDLDNLGCNYILRET